MKRIHRMNCMHNPAAWEGMFFCKQCNRFAIPTSRSSAWGNPFRRLWRSTFGGMSYVWQTKVWSSLWGNPFYPG